MDQVTLEVKEKQLTFQDCAFAGNDGITDIWGNIFFSRVIFHAHVTEIYIEDNSLD